MPPLPSGSDALPDAGGSALAALGAQLRQAREARGLAAEALAERLRIGVEQLQALENADTAHLPEPVFVIAQLRRVAAALQLEIDAPLQALRRSGELERLTGRPARISRPAAPTSGSAPASRPPGARAAAHITPPSALGTDQATASSSGSAASGAGRSTADAAPTARPTPAAAPGADATHRPSGGVDLRRLGLGAGALLLLLALLWGGWRLRPSSPQGASRPAPPSPPATSPNTPAEAAGSASLPPPATLELVSPEPSWVEVRRPDGTSLYRGLLNGRQQFPLGQGLEVLAGRPDLVRHRIGRGPSRPLGPISEVRWWTLDPQP